MPRVETTQRTLFKFKELSENAQQKALEKLYDINIDLDWWDYVYEHAARIADIIGIDLKQKPVKLMGGSTRYDPAIYFSGFSSQGDGACFEGTYEYKKGALKAIKSYASQDTDLHVIAQMLQDVQSKNLYRLHADVKHRGHYNHSGCMNIDVYDRENNSRRLSADADETVKESLRDFANWIYKQLEKQHDFLTSEDMIKESIECNDYEFTEEGVLA